MADQEKKPEAEQGEAEGEKDVKEQGLWDQFEVWGKRFIILSGIVASLWGGFQFLKPNDTFDVDLIYGPFSPPPQLVDKLPADAKPAFQPLKGQITLSIKNVSGRPVEDVGIQGQGKGFALVDAVFEGKKRPSEFTGRIEIGQMPAEATVIVTIWVDSSITPAYPVIIDHKAGFQAVALRSASEDKYGVGVYCMALVLFILACVGSGSLLSRWFASRITELLPVEREAELRRAVEGYLLGAEQLYARRNRDLETEGP